MGIKPENGTVKSENGTVNGTVKPDNDIATKKDIVINMILQIITETENISTDDIAKKIGKSRRTTRRYLNLLKKENKIEFYGAPKTGGYRIIEHE